MEKETNYCGYGKSYFIKPPEWALFNASCKIHDDNYEQGGNRFDRLTADVGFFWRMVSDCNKQETLKLKRKAVYIAVLYFILVRMFGWASFNYK